MKKIIYPNNIKWIPVIAFITMNIVSCKKLIEIPANPPNEILEKNVFADSVNTMSAVAGIYNTFGVGAYSLLFHSGGLTACTGLTGDELVTIPTNDADYVELNANAVTADNGAISGLWVNAYHALYLINASLKGISESTGISASLKQQLTGELKVDRALYYFNLVNMYGGVPLVLSTDFNVTKSQARAPVDDIYAQILMDLTDAQKLLTEAYPSAGRARPNLYTANALLAKFYLYRGDWQNAEAMASSIINSGLYSLVADLNSVFIEGSNEAIWQLPCNGSYYQTAEAANFVPYAPFVQPYYSLTANLINAFEPGDLRIQQWAGVNTVNENGNDVNYYYPYKYKNTSSSATPAEDYMVFRLGELYLIRAEALAHENKLTEALDDINLVRLRAGLSPAAASDQDATLAVIMHERQTELFCEWANRWFDLKRTGVINAVLSAEKPGWKPEYALFPIPLPEIKNNPFLQQNPGY